MFLSHVAVAKRIARLAASNTGFVNSSVNDFNEVSFTPITAKKRHSTWFNFGEVTEVSSVAVATLVAKSLNTPGSALHADYQMRHRINGIRSEVARRNRVAAMAASARASEARARLSGDNDRADSLAAKATDLERRAAEITTSNVIQRALLDPTSEISINMQKRQLAMRERIAKFRAEEAAKSAA